MPSCGGRKGYTTDPFPSFPSQYAGGGSTQRGEGEKGGRKTCFPLQESMLGGLASLIRYKRKALLEQQNETDFFPIAQLIFALLVLTKSPCLFRNNFLRNFITASRPLSDVPPTVGYFAGIPSLIISVPFCNFPRGTEKQFVRLIIIQRRYVCFVKQSNQYAYSSGWVNLVHKQKHKKHRTKTVHSNSKKSAPRFLYSL